MVENDRREASRFMDEQINAIAELREVRCGYVVAEGEAFDGILRTAQAFSADLIVMGAHRKQLLRDIFVGTTTERVIRIGPFPVLLVNNDADYPYKKLLAAIDMSEASARAITIGKTLGLLDNADLAIVHAFFASARGTMFVADAPPEQIESYVTEVRLRATAQLIAFLEANELGSQRFSRCVEEGPPFEVISEVVKRTMPDLLIMATHGRSGIAKILLGSVTEEVLRALDVDVLAVPPIR
jgi:universal stress protein E